MSGTVANSIVVIAIVIAALYCVWRLGPRRMRDAVRMRFGKTKSPAEGCDACEGCAPASSNQPAPRKEHAVIWRKKPAS
jgi:hypothetical protein